MARAKELLAVADGASFEGAARAAGRKSGDAVARLVARFNRDGIDALVEHHGGGQSKLYTETEQEQIKDSEGNILGLFLVLSCHAR